MDEVRDGLLYTEGHAWVRLDGGRARFGMTDHAQHELGEVVYVELPRPGDEVRAGGEVGAMESVKSVEPVCSPVAGRVVAVNGELEGRPSLVNESPYDEGWMAEVELAAEPEPGSLMDADAYRRLLGRTPVRRRPGGGAGAPPRSHFSIAPQSTAACLHAQAGSLSIRGRPLSRSSVTAARLSPMVLRTICMSTASSFHAS